MSRAKVSFAPTARVFLTEARGAGNPYASQGLGELDRLEALVREVRKHAAGHDSLRPDRPCRCSGPRECLLEIIDRTDDIVKRSASPSESGTGRSP